MHTGHLILTLGTCPDAAAPMAGGATLLPRHVPATRTDLREENVRGRGGAHVGTVTADAFTGM